MATLAYPYSVRDSTNASTDNRKTGLTPTISDGKTLAASPATVTALGNVSVVPIGAGDYVALYDAEAHGDASFPIDWGAALTNPNDRYGTLILTRDTGRILAGLDASAGWGAWNARRTLQAIAQYLFGLRSGVPAAGTAGTITYTGPSSVAYGTVTVDTNGNVTASSLSPPA